MHVESGQFYYCSIEATQKTVDCCLVGTCRFLLRKGGSFQFSNFRFQNSAFLEWKRFRGIFLFITSYSCEEGHYSEEPT